jgi:nucleolar complex protein 2
VPKTLNHHIPVKESATGRVYINSDSKKFKTLASLVKSHTASTLHLMANLSDSKTLRLTLSSLLDLLPYLMSFRKLLKELVKVVANIWADTTPDEATKIAAFLVLRRLVVISDAGIREAVLKAVYQGLVKGSRNTTVHTIQGINLVKNSAAELWGIDPAIGYTTGFGFIRQLAIHLRSSITNKTKDSYKAVYNWQCVNSLDFWSRVLAQHCSGIREAELGKESPLRPLIYPVVQVTLGVMRLIPTAQYFPLKFQLFRSLLRISQATKTYIPLASSLYEVLTSAEMRRPAKSSTVKALDFPLTIRASKSLLKTRVYQDGVGEQLVELFSEFFVLYCKSVAFPELALPLIVMLKRWLKEMAGKKSGNRNGKVNSAILLFVQKLEANSTWVSQQRAKVNFAPNNRSGVEKFLADVPWESSPMGAFVAGQRKAKEDKARTLEQGRKRDEAKRVKEEKKQAKEEAKYQEKFSDEDTPEEELGDSEDVDMDSE